MRRNRMVRRVRTAVTAALLATGVVGCSVLPATETPQPVSLTDQLTDRSPVAATSAKVPAAPAPASGTWLSGAAGPGAANGKFGAWRRAPLAVGGTWNNNPELAVTLPTVCGRGEWARWNRPLDLAVGAIDKDRGETWEQAAIGTYDDRWRRSLLRLKQCWGKRDPANLYIRFAHEMNLGLMNWNVQAGEEAFFVAAITRYSDLRYQILPKAKIVLCPSDGTDGDLKLDVRTLWPGRDERKRPIVDIYAIDTYNGYAVVRNAREFVHKLNKLDDDGYLFGMETHRAFALEKGVPFAVSEWANNGDPKDAGKGGEAPEYVQLMHAYFKEHAGDPRRPRAGQLLYEVYFNTLPQFQLLPTRHQPQTAAAYRALTWGR